MAEGGGGGGGGGVSGTMEQLAALIPMEDAVEALINYLVSPLLPVRASSQPPPTVGQQKAVAKQMHSVVLLYNYYHRKQFPQLKFLAFEPFCKAASIAKPSILVYMNFMHKYEEGSEDLDKHLSIMEDVVMDACNISSALDASKNAPNMDGWTISQVAMFLVDPKKEKCLLEFCSMTQGVWSLVEKELDRPVKNLVGRTQMKNHSSNVRSLNGFLDESLVNEDELQQLAFSAVEQKTGRNHSNFSILECHMAYSLSREKTTTRLYIMNYIEAANEGLVEFPIKDVISSLQGPLIRTGQTSEVTSVVEYYHLLPYLNILSNWLSREMPCGDLLPSLKHLADVDKDSLLKLGKALTTECQGINNSDLHDKVLGMPSDNMTKSENKATNNNKRSNSSSRKESNDCIKNANASGPFLEPDRQPFINDETIADTSTLNECKTRTDHAAASRSASSSVIYMPSDTEDNASLNQHQQPTASAGMRSRENVLSDIHISNGENKYVQDASTSANNGCPQKSKQQCHCEDEIARCEMNIQALLTEGEGNMNTEVESIIEACNAPCSSQMHVITSFSSGETHLPQKVKDKGFQEAAFSLQSSCKELDDVCYENSWMLPKYRVLPSVIADGMYRAIVTIEGMDFQRGTVHGDMKSSPREARASAATHMLSKLLGMTSQAQE